jgi:cytochrome P450
VPELPSASLAEVVQFNQLVVLPNAVQGIFRRRPTAVAVATRAGVDGRAVRLVSGLRRAHAPGPVWVRVMKDRALLLLEIEDVRRVLEDSPQQFASDPPAKRRGMSHFQPDALTLSRGELWADRRRFTEAVAETGRPAHHLGDHFADVCREEVAVLVGEVERDDAGVLGYDAMHRTFRRITRRVVLGDAAREDEALSDLLATLMSEANGLPGERSESYDPFAQRVERYVETGEAGSLTGCIARAPASVDTCPAGQVPHWLFALQDTLSVNVLRALALIAAHPSQRERLERELAAARSASPVLGGEQLAGLEYLRACLCEAMRLWTTTPLLSRETLVELSWRGARVPAGTQILIFNTFHHRDRERLPYADRFAPEEWTKGDAGADWGLNFFSHGPQGCPGADLALLVGSAVVAELLAARELASAGDALDPVRPLPHMLDAFALRFTLAA